MKQIIFFILLLTAIIYSQPVDTTGGSVPFDSSLYYTKTFSDLKYQTKAFLNVKDFGAVGDSVTDDTDAFQNAINAGDKIFVPEGVYTVDSLVLNSNTEFTGAGNGSKICLASGGTVLFDITTDDAYLGLGLKSGIKISNVWLSGLAEDAFAYANPIGTRVGIHLDNVNNINIDNCKITGFTLAGIVGEATNGSVTYCFNNQVTNCLIEYNYRGIWLKNKSEYGFYSNNLIQYYYEGVKVDGGNNAFSNNQILNGQIGFHFGTGTNDAHGTVTGGSVNHNNDYSFLMDSSRTTQIINGVNIWYGDIKFNFARAFKFTNCTVMTDTIWFVNGDCANSGFINCTFKDDIDLIDRDKGTDQSIMKNNNFFGTLTGLTDQEINDEDFVPAIMDISGLPTMEYVKTDSSYTEITDDSNINFGTKDFTLEWFGYVKPDGTFQILIDKTTNADRGYQLRISSNNDLQFLVRGATETYSTWGTSPEITEGYYHVVATKQDTNLAFYINGDSIDVFSRPLLTPSTTYYEPTITTITNAEVLTLGLYKYPSSWHFNGGMNLVRLYNFAATSTQAVSMYTNGQPSLSEVPYKYKWGSQDSLTSGTLELGKTYIIDDWITGDNFTNVGGTNADSSIFIATGTTPTTWTNSSILRKLGCVVEYRAENSGITTWEDNSDNGLDGTNVNVTPNYSTYIIALPDTAGITTGYVPKKQADGTILWQPDISTAGAGLFNPDGITIDTTALGVARITLAYQDTITAKMNRAEMTSYSKTGHTHAISAVVNLQDSLTAKANTAWFAISPTLIDDSIAVKMNRSEMTSYSTTTHTHIEFSDTVRVGGWSIGFGNTDIDTIITGSFSGIKLPNDYTVTEVAAYTNTGTVTFNIEERAEATPNTSGTDVMTSDLVADTDQQETGTFSNATLDRNDWLILTIVSISGEPTIFSVTVRGVKTD